MKIQMQRFARSKIETYWKFVLIGTKIFFIRSAHCVNFIKIFEQNLDFFQWVLNSEYGEIGRFLSSTVSQLNYPSYDKVV
jgi:hypothetical protein